MTYYQAIAVIEQAKARTGAEVTITFRMPLVTVAIPGFGTYEALAVELAEAVEHVQTPAQFVARVEDMHYITNPL